MPLSRLQNFLRNPTGSVLYVDPNNFEATDSFQNRGDSATTPFKTIQRALIESARFSFRLGRNNDRNDRTTILVSSGVHYIDNRPGFSLNLINGTGEFKRITSANTWSVTSLSEFDENSNFNIFDENNDLYKYNSVEGGVILPRGTSIIGLDLRKTKIKPLYVPDPENDSVERSSIFKITGSCFFSSFSFFDADPAVASYSDYANTKRVPTYSHHKLTAFTYADGVNRVRLGNEQLNLTDLDMYYYKVSKAYTSIPDYTLDISPVVDEYRIVGELKANAIGISSIRSGNGDTTGLRNEITVTTADALTNIIEPHGLFPDSPILISGVDVDASAYNGSFTVKSIVSPTVFTYTSNATPVNPLPSSLQIQDATVVVETDSVSSASPYIFSCSLRSVYGLCGLWADGSKADGFKSVVVAQFTGVSLQKDNNAFIVYNNGTYSDNTSLPANDVGRPLHTNSNAIYKPNYENFHIRATNDAYMQCVSVFAIGYARHFLTESGADIDITNSNSNFGSCALESSGFKSTSFDRDDCGYITHIIPPRELEYRTNRINWLPLDVVLTKDATNSTNNRLYLYEYDDVGILPPHKIEGYRVGAKVDELLYLAITLNGQSVSLSSPVLMPTFSGNGISAKKVYTVSRNNSGVNSISSNQITFTSTHQFITGEKVRVFSNTGQVPDGLETDVIYYAIRVSTTVISLASTYNDAIAGNSITGINNNGGILTVVSSVTDKIPGDIGHPIQYDTVLNNWYINSSPNNQIYTNLLTSTETLTPSTTIVRRPETRSVEDRLYKIRYVIPKEFTNARPPEFGFILQESKSVETSSYSANSAELPDTIALRNDKVIYSASVGSILNNTQIVTIQTEVPHKFIVGDIVKLEKIRSTNNPTATGIVSTYNGTYEITSIPSSNKFTYELKGADANPGTFTNNLSVRNTEATYSQLPVVSRVAYKNSFFIYRINTVKPLVPGTAGQDGIYLLTVLSSNINVSESYGYDLYKKEFNQDVRYLYPQVDRDNYNSDPIATSTFADLKTIGKVITNDKKSSVTKEALNYFIKNTQLGFEITGVALSGVGNTTLTLTTNVEHKLNSILTTSAVSGASGLSNGNYYGYPLYLEATLTDATCNFTSTSGVISAFKILDSGSNFNVGNILTIGTSGNATVTVSSINNNVGDGLQLSGFLQNNFNGVFRILNTANSKSVAIHNPIGVSTYIPNTNSELPFALLSSENITATSFSFTNISSGIATVTTSPSHGLFVGNKITIVGTGRTIYDKDFTVNSVLTPNTFTIKIEGATSIPSSSPGTVLKHTLSANAKVLGNGEENLASRASYIYGGIRKTVSNTAISLTSTTLTLDSSSGFSRGDYIQINNEVLRLVSNPSGNTFTVLRGQFGTIKTTAVVGTIVTKIKVLPMEVRRPSFMMASGHTFRYLGYGPGNYSTAVPQKQTRVLTEDDVLKSQAKELSGGTVVYSGLNDRGDSFSGAKKQSSITGQETVVEAPIITFTGDDVDADSASKLEGTFDTILVRDKLTVEGGPDGTETSLFYGPVKIDDTLAVNVLQFNSLDGSGSVNIISPSNLNLNINAGVSINDGLYVGAGVTVTSSITANAFIKRNEDGTKYLRADGIASSITSGNITSALGYVPANSASIPTGNYPKGNSLIVDSLTPAFDGLTSTYTLRIAGVEYDVPGNSGGANLIVSLGDVIQKAGTDYILLSNPASGLQQSRISFTSVPPVGIECFILALGGQGALLSDTSWVTKGQIPVALSGNNALMLNVGANGSVLTADSNAGVGVTWSQVTSVGIATNLKGGSTGAIPYQSSPNNTTFANVGAAGSVFSSNGTIPSWRPLTGATATWGSISNSSTSVIDFTNIPTWAREITVMFDFLGFTDSFKYVTPGGNSHLGITLQPTIWSVGTRNLGYSNSFFIQGGFGSGQVITNDSIGCYIGDSGNAISGQVTFKKFDNFVAGQYIWYATGSWTYPQNGPNPSNTVSGWVSGSIFSPPSAGTGWQPVTTVRLFASNDDYFGGSFGGSARDTRIQVSYQ